MRYRSLDSLRGLAALSVFAFHSWPFGSMPTWALVPPISLLWSGRQAVILFFVLSGLVLTRSYERAGPGWFLAKRVVRLYPLYALAILVSAALAPFVVGRPVLDGTGRAYAQALTVLTENLPMVLGSRHGLIDGPIWSLVHEMRFSLIFPLLVALMTFAKRYGWFVLAITAPLSLVGFSAPAPFDSLIYLPSFLLGIWLAQEQEAIAGLYSRTPVLVRGSLIAALLMLYGVPWTWASPLLGSVASAGIITLALNEPRARQLLMWAPLLALGDASFAVYLTHSLILDPARILLPVAQPLLVVGSWLIVLPLSLAAARWIDGPAVRLSRRLQGQAHRRALQLPEPEAAL